ILPMGAIDQVGRDRGRLADSDRAFASDHRINDAGFATRSIELLPVAVALLVPACRQGMDEVIEPPQTFLPARLGRFGEIDSRIEAGCISVIGVDEAG